MLIGLIMVNVHKIPTFSCTVATEMFFYYVFDIPYRVDYRKCSLKSIFL